MLGRDKQFKDVKDYLSDVSIETLVAVMLDKGFVCTKIPEQIVAPDDVLVTASAKFIAAGGRPLVDVQVSVSAVISDYTITSGDTGEVFRPCQSAVPTLYYSDANGAVSFKLFKGSTVLISTSMSSAVRQVTVPDQDFSIFSEGVEVGTDLYTSVDVAKDYLIRRDL